MAKTQQPVTWPRTRDGRAAGVRSDALELSLDPPTSWQVLEPPCIFPSSANGCAIKRESMPPARHTASALHVLHELHQHWPPPALAKEHETGSQALSPIPALPTVLSCNTDGPLQPSGQLHTRRDPATQGYPRSHSQEATQLGPDLG